MLARGTIETTDLHIHGAVKIRGTKPGFFLRGKTCHHGMNDTRSRAVGNAACRIANGWRQVLSPAQRTAWETFAFSNPTRKHSGRVLTLNGFQVYSKYQHTRITLGLPMSVAPPSGVLYTTAPLLSLNVTVAGTITFQFDNAALWTKDVSHVAVLVDTGPASRAVRQSKVYSRIVGFFPGIPIIGYPIALSLPRPFPAGSTGGTAFTYLIRVT